MSAVQLLYTKHEEIQIMATIAFYPQIFPIFAKK